MGTVFTVDNYKVALGRNIEHDSNARIICWGTDGTSATVIFVNSKASMRENTYSERTRAGMLFLPAEQFSWYVDLLRNEQPVMVVMDVEEPEWHYFQTMREQPPPPREA